MEGLRENRSKQQHCLFVRRSFLLLRLEADRGFGNYIRHRRSHLFSCELDPG
jgi:hypothetical protein